MKGQSENKEKVKSEIEKKTKEKSEDDDDMDDDVDDEGGNDSKEKRIILKSRKTEVMPMVKTKAS